MFNYKQLKIVHLSFGLTFLFGGMTINFLQFLIYILLRPISKYWFRVINYYLFSYVLCFYAFLSEWWSKSTVKLYMDEKDFAFLGKEHTLCVLNHSYDTDWLFLSVVMNNRNALGNCRTYAKKELIYLPVSGWVFGLGENVNLSRSYEKDVLTIKKYAKYYGDYPSPISVFLCPEGTRFTREKWLQAMEYAKSKGLPTFKHHLTIRTKGFTTTLPFVKDKFGSVLDITVAFDPKSENKPTILDLLNGKPVTAHIYIKRYPMAQVPSDDESAVKFLQNLFEIKDKMVDSFFNTGSFFTESGVPEVKSIEIRNHTKTLINYIFWTTFVHLIIIYLIIHAIIVGNFMVLAVILFVLIGLYIILIHFIKINRIKGTRLTN